jgi:hypothetical protein
MGDPAYALFTLSILHGLQKNAENHALLSSHNDPIRIGQFGGKIIPNARYSVYIPYRVPAFGGAPPEDVRLTVPIKIRWRG